MQPLFGASGVAPLSEYRDLASRRWVRAFFFHLMAIGPFLFLWAAPLALRAGLLPSLLSFLSPRLYLAFAIFDLSQVLFVLARHAIVVADASPIPSSTSLLASAAKLAGFSGAASPSPLVHQDPLTRASHGAFRGPVSQWELEAAWATLSGRTKFVALCAAAGAAGAISLSLFRQQLLGGALEINSGSGLVGDAGFGVVIGLLFAAYHLVRRDYLLSFPALQRAPFYRFKASLPRCATSAATFGCVTSALWSLLLRPLLLPLLASATTTATGIPLPLSLTPPPLSPSSLLLSLFSSAYSSLFLAFSWEAVAAATEIFLTHRHLFLPPPNSPSSPAAPLLLALSPPSPTSASLATSSSPLSLPLLALPSPPSLNRLILHWAFLDLSLLGESEADTWRRAALFESQEVYSAVVSACLLPIDSMTARVAAAAGYPTVTTTLQQQQEYMQEQQQYSLQSPMDTVPGAGFASAERLRWRQGQGIGEGQQGQVQQGGGAGASGGYGGGFGGFGGGWSSAVGSATGIAGGGGAGGMEGRRRVVRQPTAAEVSFDWQLCTMAVRSLAALTAASRQEDRLGVAQMSHSNAAALSSLLSSLLSLDALLVSPSHRPPAAPATFSGFGEASSQAGVSSGAGQPPFLHQSSGAGAAAGGLFGTPTLGLRYGSTEPGVSNPGGVSSSPFLASSVSAIGAASGAVRAGVYGEGLVGPVWGEAWAMADVVRTALYRIVESFGEEMVEKGGGGAIGGVRGGGAASWKVDETWLPGDMQPLFGSREAHAAKLLALLDHRD